MQEEGRKATDKVTGELEAQKLLVSELQKKVLELSDDLAAVQGKDATHPEVSNPLPLLNVPCYPGSFATCHFYLSPFLAVNVSHCLDMFSFDAFLCEAAVLLSGLFQVWMWNPRLASHNSKQMAVCINLTS